MRIRVYQPVRAVAKSHQAKMRQKPGQRGLTLVELMVAMTISLFMLLAIALVYSTSKTGFAFANNTVRMSEDASFALEMMSRDIRIAGYAGCSGTTVAVDGAGVTTYTPKLNAVSGLVISSKPNPFVGVGSGEIGAQIFTANNSVWGFAANNSSAIGILGGGTTTYTPSATEPMLYLAGGSNQALQVSDAVGAVGDNINILANTYGWSNTSTPTFLIISDCKGSEVFRADSVTATSGKYAISHAATVNNTANLAHTYGSDALVTSLNTSVYFVATRSGAATPSLYRRNFNGTAAVFEEIVPNVEKITFQYGINTSNIGAGLPNAGLPTYQADSYESNPASVADWSRVVSIRMGLIMVSEEDSQGTSMASQSIPWLGGTYTSPSDARLRRAYSTTVSIRNRMGL